MTTLGIIGCGDIVNLYQGFSSPLLQSTNLEITALIDTNIDNAKKISHAFPNARVVEKINEAVLKETDAFLIAVPNHLHHYYGKICLQEGKHVLMEKPLAITRAECEELVALRKKNNLILMVALCMRFHPLIHRLKYLLDEQYYGELIQLSIWTEQYTTFPKHHWHTQRQTLGGGQLFSHGCHYIDLLMWIMGHPVQGFFLGTNKGTPWMEKEGTTNVCLKFANNALGYYFGTWGARGSRNDYLIQAHNSQGMLEVDFKNSAIKLYSEGCERDIKQFYMGYTKETILFHEPIDLGVMYQNEMFHFLNCIDTRQTPLTSAEIAMQSMDVIWELEHQGYFGVGDSSSLKAIPLEKEILL